MKRLLQFLALLVISVCTVSCFKDDVKITPHKPGNTTIDTIALTYLYKNQVYYNLGTGKPVSSNLRKQWDLSFGSASDGFHVRLNTSCFMYAATITTGHFGMPADTSGVKWKFDDSNGNVDSTAIGNWLNADRSDSVSMGNLIIINRGLDELGNPRGFRQLLIDSLSNNTYYFRVADFNGSDPHAFQVVRDPLRNHVLFSFDDFSGDFQEPPRVSWDLLFSQYTTLLFTDKGEPYPYLVTGVLLNPDQVEVAQDSLTLFDNITFETAKNLTYSKRQDIIGYDWKYYSFATGVYTVRTNLVYIIRDEIGFYYKFRFLGFYNEKGEKGYPTIEFQRL